MKVIILQLKNPRISLFFLTFSVFLIYNTAQAGEIMLNSTVYSQEITLMEAINHISEKYQVLFNYDRKIVSDITVQYEPDDFNTVNEAITSVLKDTDLKYQIFNQRYVVLYKNDQEGIESLKEMIEHFQAIVDYREDIVLNRQKIKPAPKLIRAETQNLLGDRLLSFSIEGIVTDQNGELLIGVNIQVKGTTQGTATDFEGRFTLEDIDENAVLVVSYIGYQTQEVPVTGKSVLAITLISDSQLLDEVVVVGYGTQKRSDITGSVASIKSDEINRIPTTRFDDALRGKISGLHIVPTSSQPGAAMTIRIRGSNSISANNEPLVVVDGFIGGVNLNSINTEDIESIEVLKDASATSLFGSRGANGVILVTTKRGVNGTEKLSYSSTVSYQSPLKLFDLMNASEYGAWMNEINKMTLYPNPESLGEGTDWQKEFYRKVAFLQSHTISASGGNQKTNYYLSGNYFDQDGLVIESNYKRYQFRFNLDSKVNNRLKIGNSLTASRIINKPRYSIHQGILSVGGFPPTLAIYDDKGNFTIQEFSTEFSNDNPVAYAKLDNSLVTNTNILGSIYAELDLISGLKYKISLGAKYGANKNTNYQPSTQYRQRGSMGTARKEYSENLDLLLENLLIYEQIFGKHSLNVVGGYTRQMISNENTGVTVQRFPTDFFEINNLGAGVDRTNSTSSSSERGFESYLFRTNYGYNNKYLLTLSGRADGASVFAQNNKWAFFPTVSAAWRLSEERFFNSTYINSLKIRGSVGRLGNPGLNFGASLTRLSPGGNSYALGLNEGEVAGIAVTNLGNDNLKWETTSSIDVGLDISLFNYRIDFTIDLYSNKTNDLLFNQEILWLTGFANSLTNFGSVSNSGLEIGINSINIESRNFSWSSNLNISTNKNEVLKILNKEGFIYTNPIGVSTGALSGILKEGEPIGVFYGLISKGVWHSEEEIKQAGIEGGFSVFPGGRRYEDVDGDGIVNQSKDRVIIGDPNPTFFGGFGNSFDYKNFSLSLFFTFSVGNDIFNETYARFGSVFDHNSFKEFVDRWTPENSNSNIPSVEGLNRTLTYSSTALVENGSYLRLRNINVNYRLPVKNKNIIKSAIISVSAINLFTLDEYRGYDVEINRGTGNLRRGYDNSQFPGTKSINFGLNVTF